MIINYRKLASSRLRSDALDILVAGIESALPGDAMQKNISFSKGILKVYGDRFDASRGRIYVIGFGKASAAMAKALEKIIPPKSIAVGIVNCSIDTVKTKKVRVNKASHPVPDKKGAAGLEKMLEIAKNAGKNDIVICLVSGGGSALLPDPAGRITLNDLKKMTELMLKSGAKSYELNNLRKHTSRFKGGNLARVIQPAKVISLILSDVINENDVTASGPTSPDNSTFKQSYDVLKKYDLLEKMPRSIISHLKGGMRGNVPETAKPGEKFLKNVHNYILADYRTALNSMRKKASELGFDAEILPNHTEGEVKTVAGKMAELFRQKGSLHKKKFALIYSSENRVTVSGNGKGGRSQEYIGYLIKEIKDFGNCVAASIDSDGTDFLPGVGGAISDSSTYSKSQKMNIDIGIFLKNNNSFELHKRLNTLILMKPTNTNVGDINVYLRG